MVETYFYMEKHQTYFNLLDALKEKGCPVCNLVQKTTHMSMDSFLYERVNDPGERKEIRKALGFCNTHAWQLQKFGDGFGLSIIFNELLGMLNEKISSAVLEEDKKKSKTLLKELTGRKAKPSYQEKAKTTCPICNNLRDCEKRYINTFIDGLKEAEFRIAFSSSYGLCLPHIVSVLAMCKDEELLKELLKTESEKIGKLRKELDEFERKHDYRFSKEGFGKEGNSWIRAIEKMIGREGMY